MIRMMLVGASALLLPLAIGSEHNTTHCGYVQSVVIRGSGGRTVRVAPWRVLQLHDQGASVLSFRISGSDPKESRTLHVSKSTRFLLNDEETNWINVLAVAGAGFRIYPISVASKGSTALVVNNKLGGMYGVLRTISPKEIHLVGYRTVPEIDQTMGIFANETDPSGWVRDMGKEAVVLHARLTPRSKAFLNLDPVPVINLRRVIGRIVEVVPSCEGDVRYIDALTIDRVFNFSGGNNAFLYRSPTRRGRGQLKRAYALFDNDVDTGVRRTYRLSKDVKVYGLGRELELDRLKFGTPLSGLAGACIDRLNGDVTHIFWSEEAE